MKQLLLKLLASKLKKETYIDKNSKQSSDLNLCEKIYTVTLFGLATPYEIHIILVTRYDIIVILIRDNFFFS